jgi:hypothetical protein
MFELDNMLNSATGTWVFVAALIVFIMMVWGAPVLHRLILPSSLHNNSVARAGTIAALLIATTVAATITMRSSTTKAVASANAQIAIDELHKSVDLQALPEKTPPEPF